MKKTFTLLCSLIIVAMLQAQSPLLIEHFDYPAGDSIIRHGWFSHSGTTNYIRTTNGGLSWSQTPYWGSGVGNAAAVNNTGSDENRPFSRWVDSGNVYVSFLLKVNTVVTTTNRGFFFHLGEYLNPDTPILTDINSAFRARTYKAPGSSAAKFKLGITFNSATAPSGFDLTADLDTGSTYLVVVKYHFIPGADNDSVSLFVFADGDDISLEPIKPTLGPYAGTAPDLKYVQLAALRQYNAGQRVVIDGIIAQQNWNLLPPKEELAAFDLLTPANGTSLTVTSGQTDQANISWRASKAGSLPVTYEWMAVAAGGSFTMPALTLPSNMAGTDTVLTLTLGALDAALAGLGLNPGDSIALDWTVRVKADTMSRLANQVWRIRLKRAEPSTGIPGVIKGLTLAVFPNPAKEEVTIQLNNTLNGTASMRITDQLGRTLLSGTLNASQNNLDVSSLKDGIYWIHVANGTQYAVKTLLIQH